MVSNRLKELLTEAKRELDAADTIIVRPSMVNPSAFVIRTADVGRNMVHEYTYNKNRRYQVVIHDRVVYDKELFGEPDE